MCVILQMTTAMLTLMQGSENTPACPSDNQLSNVACPGQVLVYSSFY